MHQVQKSREWGYLQSFWKWRLERLRCQLEEISPERLPRLQGAISELRLLLDDETASQIFNEFDETFAK